MRLMYFLKYYLFILYIIQKKKKDLWWLTEV